MTDTTATETTSAVERVAAAIWARQTDPSTLAFGYSWDSVSPDEKDEYRADAAAALDAVLPSRVLTLDAAGLDRMKRLIAAIYWCGGDLDKDEICDDAGEPLRLIGNQLEDILGINIDLTDSSVWATAEQDATGPTTGLAHAFESYLMPSRIVRDAIETADLAKAVREVREHIRDLRSDEDSEEVDRKAAARSYGLDSADAVLGRES